MELAKREKQSVQKNASILHPAKKADVLRRVFYVVFAAVFAVLFAQVVFANMHFTYLRPVWVIGAALLWGALFIGLFWLTKRFTSFFEKREKFYLFLFFVLLAVTQVFFYSQTAAYPTMDFERVFTGGVNFSVNGFIEEPYIDYFYKYPNNMPLTIVLQFFFRLANRLGYTNFYVVGALLNVAAVLATYIFTYLCCRRLFGVSRAFFALFLLYLCLPLQCYISVFYTDTLTLPFAPFAFYLYLRLRDAKTWKGILAAAFILAGGMAFGVKLKYSVIITLIAVAIDMVLQLDFKKLALTAALFAAVFAVCNAGFNGFMYAHFLDKSLADDRATPFSSWIMMGLKGDGAHDPNDNYLIWNWPTAEEKQKQAMEEIKARLGSYTPASFMKFLNQKAIRSFGSGDLDATRTVADSPMRQTFMVECVSPGGRYFEQFSTVVQGYHVALFGLVITGAVLAAKRKDDSVFVPCLSIFGLFLFLLLWESGQRYLLNYFAMYIMAAAYGADLPQKVWSAAKEVKNKKDMPKQFEEQTSADGLAHKREE